MRARIHASMMAASARFSSRTINAAAMPMRAHETVPSRQALRCNSAVRSKHCAMPFCAMLAATHRRRSAPPWTSSQPTNRSGTMKNTEDEMRLPSEDAGAFVHLIAGVPPGLVYVVEKATGRMFWAKEGSPNPEWRVADSDDPEFDAALRSSD